MKICKICGIEKDESEFYFQNDKIHLKPYCKLCHKIKYTKAAKESGYYKTYQNKPEVVLKRRERQNRNKDKLALNFKNKYKGKYYRNANEYNKLYPEKRLANTASNSAKIKVDKGFEKHHWSYNKEHWLDIIILPISRHRIAHRNMIYDQERMMFRRLDGILLDTKEEHIKYIDSLL